MQALSEACAERVIARLHTMQRRAIDDVATAEEATTQADRVGVAAGLAAARVVLLQELQRTREAAAPQPIEREITAPETSAARARRSSR